MRIPFPPKVVKVVEHGVMAWVGTFLVTYSPVVLNASSLHSLLDLSVADKAATAALAGVMAMVLANLGLKVGDKSSTSFVAHLAEQPSTPQGETTNV